MVNFQLFNQIIIFWNFFQKICRTFTILKFYKFFFFSNVFKFLKVPLPKKKLKVSVNLITWKILECDVEFCSKNMSKIHNFSFILKNFWKFPFFSLLWLCTRKKLILEKLPNSSETEDMRKIR